MQLRNPQILEALIEVRNLRKAHLAAAVGCGRSFIGHLLAGRRTGVSDELGQRIAEVLDVPEDILFAPTTSAASGSNDRTGQEAA